MEEEDQTDTHSRSLSNRFKTITLSVLLIGTGITCLAQEEKPVDKSQYLPQIHGQLRGKYEYEPDLNASRFELRNARVSVEGNLPFRSSYKVEVDLYDETELKMKEASVSINPWKTLQFTIGHMRLPFTIDAHRTPTSQYFANRSFIAKQTGNMYDVGAKVGYTFKNSAGKKVAVIDAGLYNGSSLNDEKVDWHSDWSYSARLQLYPVDGLVIMPSIQHMAIATHQAHYTSVDIGAYYERKGWHVEGEYLHKTYNDKAFDGSSSVDAMLFYKQPIKNEKAFLESISYLGRYDYMGDHSDGKSGFEEERPTRLVISDYERHRMTLGVTFGVRNPYFHTDIRINYEKYWYPHGGAKESEQDKFVAELSIQF